MPRHVVGGQGFTPPSETIYVAGIEAGADEGLTVETSTEEDVEVVAIRQTTTKKTGYHTKDRAIRRIAGFAWDCTAEILSTTGAVPRAGD